MLKKKNREIIIGSNNTGKIREIRDLLPKFYKIFTPDDFNLKSPKENGKSFIENSLIKAKYYSKKSGKICIADDSGLEIDLLNRAPGIFSARWGGKKGNFNIAINKVFRELIKKDKEWRNKKIVARFICALTIYGLKKKPIHSLGVVNGFISNKKKGRNGFGYDPIFIPHGRTLTFAQIKPSIKYKIDHRYIAFKKIKKFF
ncbi:MAG: non-canonical purine NTP pyrophosphatase [Candidatus Pelagibacter sp.]|tara:strand:+ start:10 stop:612 length:603 start_codon:yes stop_codon:yes gene_type:complete